ncbi:hypothetical protein HSB1_05780 [Halogranum salarium B-1]|uniref:Uncharacterized protein n=1 Tax=Halogranum salarium B-1 TaxID=1210908 RepID=J3F0E3_9EURY|nr:hypothetical protein HSB1_05780 [Halogranum salarium B-1]
MTVDDTDDADCRSTIELAAEKSSYLPPQANRSVYVHPGQSEGVSV